jgi:hypothetical protein
MLKLSQIPDWLKAGEFFQNFDYDESTVKTDEFTMIRHLKNDLILVDLRSVLELLDTCLYAGLDKIPCELYDFARDNTALFSRMIQFERNDNSQYDELAEYRYLIQTPEYNAVRICAHNDYIAIKHTAKVLLEEAIIHVNYPLFYYCIDDCNECELSHFTLAVEHDFTMAKYIIDKHPKFIPDIQSNWIHYRVALIKFDIQMVKYLYETIGVQMSKYVITDALFNIYREPEPKLRKQKIDFTIYLIKQGFNSSNETNLNIAITYNLIEIVEAFLDISCKVSSWCFHNAVKFGNIEIVKMLCKYGAKPNEYLRQFYKMDNEIIQQDVCNNECLLYIYELEYPSK